MFNILYEEIKESNISINSGFELYFDMRKEKDTKLLNILSRCRIPTLKAVDIAYVQIQSKYINEFLQRSLPYSIDHFGFNS